MNETKIEYNIIIPLSIYYYIIYISFMFFFYKLRMLACLLMEIDDLFVSFKQNSGVIVFALL